MANKGYIGQAGTGKTTKIIDDLNDLVKPEEWAKTSSLLAITYMHGSRRRLENKLSPFVKKGIRVNCMTIDAFCLHIVQRYKSYLGIKVQIVISDNVDERTELTTEKKLVCGIHTICSMASELLNFNTIKDVMKFSYPIIVVDEFQDCEEGHLLVIKKIAENECLLIAADDFQKLNTATDSAAVKWLNESVTCVTLDKIWRTNYSQILNTAKALRTNSKVSDVIEVKFAEAYGLAAFFIASGKEWKEKMGMEGRTVALISPIGPHSDTFVKKTLERLHRGFEKKEKGVLKWKLDKHPFMVEGEKKITVTEILKKCTGLGKKSIIPLNIIQAWNDIDDIYLQAAIKSAKRVMKLRNLDFISTEEFKGLISARLHLVNAILTQKKENRIFLTVHGAKNREFDDVFILWPQHTLKKDSEIYLRKLLYNAVTRAKRKVILIVQGTEAQRGSEPALNLLLNQ